MNTDLLRRALSRPPEGYVPPNPTSVPTVITLEEILTRAQNKLLPPYRARETIMERIRRWLVL